MTNATLARISRDWIDGTVDSSTASPAGAEADVQMLIGPKLSHYPTMFSNCCDTSDCGTATCTTECGPIGTAGVCGC